MTPDFPQVWDLLRHFKEWCKSKGWKTSESEDWVKRGAEYHNFLWTSTIHLSTFRRIATNHRCAINEGISYRVVDVSYTAWLFPQTPTENLVNVVMEDPELLRRNAIYDLSCLCADKPTCLRLNETRSSVFREFERFLQKKWGIDVKSSQEALVEEA